MNAFADSVKRRLLLVLVLQVLPSFSINVNFERNVNNIDAKTKIPIKPLIIPCLLNDVVRLSAPVINKYDQYYISKPNGDVIKLKLQAPKKLSSTRTYDLISVTFLENSLAIVKQKNSHRAYNADEFDQKFRNLDSNEFLVGPLLEEDFGNWVLSTYTRDLDDEWIELFQVITMEITSFVTLEPAKPRLNVGNTFNLSFPYPFPDIKSCEIVAPRSTFDRFYNRNSTNFNKCGFTIPNITKEDEGIWKIIGVGRIIYEGEVLLEVNKSLGLNPTVVKKKESLKKQ
ncbi:unnamed protein product [Arctia plantaginis]|uniref:Uncharacterized protein n=1 Tax=Arctia plantaginis TaxID=874455 RepID=A0A8S0ZV41_ARCPL|nr:unnamed protein product [Arctia plantaginis]